VMPDAVHGVGDMEINSKTIPNFLVVNERMLLYENLGATQQLDKDLEEEKGNIENINSQMTDLTATAKASQTQVQGKVQYIMDLLFQEEYKKKVTYAGLEEEYVNFQFSVFKTGPARSLFLLGHFAPVFWVFGALYIFSNVNYRKVLGFMSALRLAIHVALYYLFEYKLISASSYYWNLYSAMGFAVIVLFVNYRRLKRRLEQAEITKQNAQLAEKEAAEERVRERPPDGVGWTKKEDKRNSVERLFEEKLRIHELYLEQMKIQEENEKDKKKKFWNSFQDRIISYRCVNTFI